MDNLATTDVVSINNSLAISKNQHCDGGLRYLLEDQPDPLAINTICAIESFIAQFNWATSDTALTLKQQWPLTANINRGPVGNNYTLSTVAFCSTFFEFWSGSLTFKVEVLCTTFHRGRLLISYVPTYITTSSNGTDPVASTTRSLILDITTSTCLEFTVYNNTCTPWLPLASTQCYSPSVILPYPQSSATTSIVTNPGGYINIFVETPLVAPNTGATAVVNIYVKGGPDLRFNSPTGRWWQSATFVGVSTPFISPDTVSIANQGTTTSILSDRLYDTYDFEKIFFGESIPSLRPLLKRFSLVGIAPMNQSTTLVGGKDFAINSIKINAVPNFITAYNSSVGYGSVGPDTISTTPKDFFAYKPIIVDIIAMCFLGFRGGMRFKIIPSYNTTEDAGNTNPDKQMMLWAQRYGSVPQSYTISSTTYNTLATGVAATLGAPFGQSNTMQLGAVNMPWPFSDQDIFGMDGAFGGAMSLNGKPLEIQIPYSSPFLYINSSNTINQANLNFNQNYVGITMSGRNYDPTNAGVYVFKAVADDFNVFYWIGVPLVTVLITSSGAAGSVGTALSRITFVQ